MKLDHAKGAWPVLWDIGGKHEIPTKKIKTRERLEGREREIQEERRDEKRREEKRRVHTERDSKNGVFKYIYKYKTLVYKLFLKF